LDEKLVECHGHFRTAACIDCYKAADGDQVKETIVQLGETPICNYCGGNVKPDIVFFGESLPDRFHNLLPKDIAKADLLLIMGTSLQVAPVLLISTMVKCNRVLFNRDIVMRMAGSDIFVKGDCDKNVKELCDLLGWSEALLENHEKCCISQSTEDDEEPKESSSTTDTNEEADQAHKKDEGGEEEEEASNEKENTHD
jgi:NAD-dependent SIR2 family protein deacetylase